MLVTEVADNWPERTGSAAQAWVSPAQALSRIQEHGLRELIRGATTEISIG